MGNNSSYFRIMCLPHNSFLLSLAFYFHFSFIDGRKVAFLYHLTNFHQFLAIDVFLFFDFQVQVLMVYENGRL
jgi:hypothetical protein